MNKAPLLFFIAGQGFSLSAVWMHLTLLSWNTLEITNSSAWVGAVFAIYTVPTLLFSWLVGGLLARIHCTNILRITQTAHVLAMLAYTALLYGDLLKLWHVLILSFVIGTLYAVDLPCKQMVILRLCGEGWMMQGLALNSIIFNSARIVGPILAAVLLAHYGSAVGFAMAAALFLAGLTCFLHSGLNRLGDKLQQDDGAAAGDRLGIPAILRAYPAVKGILLLVLLYGLLLMNYNTIVPMMNYNTIVPIFAKQCLNGSDAGFGLLLSSMGIGSLVAAILITLRSQWFQGRYLIPLFPALIAAIYFLLPYLRHYTWLIPVFGVYGFCITAFVTCSNSAVLLAGAARHRAKLSSFYNMLLNGFAPLGNLLIGLFLSFVGLVPSLFLIGGLVLLFLAGWLVWFRMGYTRGAKQENSCSRQAQ